MPDNVDGALRYVVIQCLDCMFYECRWISWEDWTNAPVCIDCGSLDVAVVRCRPHNWERYAKSPRKS